MTRAVLVLLLCAHALQSDAGATAEMLAKAARNGDVKAIDGILRSGVDPDVPDRYGHTPLYYAVSFNETKAVELLLAHHADPNPRARSHTFASQVPDTPLENAAELGNRRVAEMLIEAGAKVNEHGPSGRTALHCANDQLDVIRLLIDKGADVNARDNEGTSALDAAVWYGSFDTVALLLAHGARLNESEPRTGATPINEAAYKGHARLVKYLLLFEPDLGIRDKRGYSPLENAMRMGRKTARCYYSMPNRKRVRRLNSLRKRWRPPSKKMNHWWWLARWHAGQTRTKFCLRDRPCWTRRHLEAQTRLWTSF